MTKEKRLKLNNKNSIKITPRNNHNQVVNISSLKKNNLMIRLNNNQKHLNQVLNQLQLAVVVPAAAEEEVVALAETMKPNLQLTLL